LSWKLNFQNLPGFQIDTPTLAECFDSGDDAAHNAAYHAADRIPTTHPQTAERATGDAEQNVADRMQEKGDGISEPMIDQEITNTGKPKNFLRSCFPNSNLWFLFS
jgi:hypothetical protein